MNPEQVIAEQRERAQDACKFMIEQGDVIHEISYPLTRARKVVDAILSGEDSPEVVEDLMDSLSEAATILDDVVGYLYNIMHPEEVETIKAELQREADGAYKLHPGDDV
jgi:hypothetical protein